MQHSVPSPILSSPFTTNGRQAVNRGKSREEPTMRVLRLTMIGVPTLLVLLSGVVWYQGLTVVDYTLGQSIGLHFQGHRMYYLQVRGCLVAAF